MSIFLKKGTFIKTKVEVAKRPPLNDPAQSWLTSGNHYRISPLNYRMATISNNRVSFWVPSALLKAGLQLSTCQTRNNLWSLMIHLQKPYQVFKASLSLKHNLWHLSSLRTYLGGYNNLFLSLSRDFIKKAMFLPKFQAVVSPSTSCCTSPIATFQ